MIFGARKSGKQTGTFDLTLLIQHWPFSNWDWEYNTGGHFAHCRGGSGHGQRVCEALPALISLAPIVSPIRQSLFQPIQWVVCGRPRISQTHHRPKQRWVGFRSRRRRSRAQVQHPSRARERRRFHRLPSDAVHAEQGTSPLSSSISTCREIWEHRSLINSDCAIQPVGCSGGKSFCRNAQGPSTQKPLGLGCLAVFLIRLDSLTLFYSFWLLRYISCSCHRPFYSTGSNKKKKNCFCLSEVFSSI